MLTNSPGIELFFSKMIRKGHLAWGRSAVSHERYRPGFSGPPKRTVLALLRSLPELEAGSSLNLETREIPLLSQLARMQAEAKLFFEPTPNSFDYRFRTWKLRWFV